MSHGIPGGQSHGIPAELLDHYQKRAVVFVEIYWIDIKYMEEIAFDTIRVPHHRDLKRARSEGFRDQFMTRIRFILPQTESPWVVVPPDCENWKFLSATDKIIFHICIDNFRRSCVGN